MIPEDKFLERLEKLSTITAEDMKETARKLLEQGKIRLEDWDDNYILPKLFLTAYASRMKDIWSPIGPATAYMKKIKEMEAAL